MRTGSLAQLAAERGMPSQPSLRALIRARPDFPILERPNGKRTAFLFNLDEASAFVRANWHDRRVQGASAQAGEAPVRAPAPDAGHGNLWDLAALPGMPSQPTLRAFIDARADFPVISRGGRGRGYLLELEAAAAFVRAHWRDSRSTRCGVARATRVREGAAADPQGALPGLFDDTMSERAE